MTVLVKNGVPAKHDAKRYQWNPHQLYTPTHPSLYNWFIPPPPQHNKLITWPDTLLKVSWVIRRFTRKNEPARCTCDVNVIHSVML